MIIRPYEETDRREWDVYVHKHPNAYHAHLLGWKYVIEQTYKKKSYYLVAEDNQKIVGVLPLFHIKSMLFGNTLVSMPYLTYGGILADNDAITKKLLDKALEIASDLKAVLELRHIKQLYEDLYDPEKTQINISKVSMRLDLPETTDELFNTFKAKLRSQIRRPKKEGMTFKLGGPELIEDFYKVFAVNMRDLGSPVHTKKLFINLFTYLQGTLKIGIVYFNNIAVGGGLITQFNDFIEIPWASTLRKYNKFSPNMLLYWSFLEYSVLNNYKIFDFGRSNPEEGTYKFKKQWECKPIDLYWYKTKIDDKTDSKQIKNDARKQIFVKIWNKLPIGVSHKIGPIIRKQISL